MRMANNDYCRSCRGNNEQCPDYYPRTHEIKQVMAIKPYHKIDVLHKIRKASDGGVYND